MSISKIIIAITSFVLLALILIRIIDLHVTIDHMSQRIASDKVALEEGLNLLTIAFVGKERTDVDTMVRGALPESIIKFEDQQTSAGNYIFVFQGVKCVSVSSLNP